VSPGALVLISAGAAPMLLALWLSARTRPLAVALVPLAPLPALALAVWGVETEVFVPGLFTGLHLGLDAVGRAFLFFTAALWMAGGAYARAYMAHDGRRDGFFAFFLLTLTGQLALVLAQDILTFYLGFAIMTFSAYGMVVHVATGRARRAGRVYIAMAVGGEAMLLSALLLIGASAGTVSMAAVPGAYQATGSPVLVAGLVIAGFGVKAGLVPLHGWLPLAHPVAPTPASALLSGAMIKAGLLGWIRFLPLGEVVFPAPGAVLVGLGVAAAFYGVVAGLAQSEAKTVLAYSSVSQMGYMAAGVGIALLATAGADPALLAVGHYAGHHAVAKASLFLAVGLAPAVLAARAGVGRRLLFYLGLAIPALALAGAPFTSGAAAKSALKAAGDALPDVWAGWIALLLSLAAGGTALLLARFLVVLHVGAREAHSRKSHRPPSRLALGLPWAGLVVLSLTAPLWLPWSFPPPPDVAEPRPVMGVVDSLWPLIMGLVLAGAMWRFEHRLPIRPGVIPPGDIVAPAIRLAAALAVTLRRAGRPLPSMVAWGWQRSRSARRRAGHAAAHLDRRMAAGAHLGVAVLLLLAILAALLLGQP
jgi:formate hydrogenlyase subunit 3/multisubunit Na+/H+ antiporter MnhD subunit